MDTTPLQPVDQQIENCIDRYSDDFWASADRDPREDLHAYMQYPAMMVPEIQNSLVRVVYNSQAGVKNVLDPFVGAGTTMTSCMSVGLNFSGQDINPLAVLVSRAKAGALDENTLGESKERIIALSATDPSTQIEADFVNIDKWFQQNVQIELSRIRRAIRRENQLWVRRFFWVALAETVRLVSNSRTSTYKLHIRSADDLGSRNLLPLETFDKIASRNLDDLKRFKSSLVEHLHAGTYAGRLQIYLQDSSKKIFPPANAAQFDLLITSPPYGDNLSTVPYGQFSYLPLQWIDLADIDKSASVDSWLRTTQEIDRRSLGGRQQRDSRPLVSELAKRSPTFESTIKGLSHLPRDRQSRVTTFLYDLDESLVPIVDILRPNAYLIWIVGNRHVGGLEIPTDRILEELLTNRNVKLIKRFNRRILYRRLATRNQLANMMREEHILVFRKLANT